MTGPPPEKMATVAAEQALPALLAKVLLLEPGEREAWLEGNVPESIAEQLRRLAELADSEGTLTLSTGADEVGAGALGLPAPPVDDSVPEERLGEVVGNYRLVELLGQGGMGAVYLGEREGDYEHRAAIKLARSGVSRTTLERLARERQLLADLNHPNIASLLDGGSTDDGDAFLVLEHVEGLAITDYCDERSLGAVEVVELFLEVCGGVEAAHRALLVHGDIKPSNLLVREDGVPKLLDFGVSQALSGDRSVPGGLAGGWTPGFASPEQRGGEGIGIPTDVFALGVLFYRLLVGRMPKQQSLGELTSMPVVSLDSEARRRIFDLPGTAEEVEAILARCTMEDPARRYPTVRDLVQDLEALLRGFPVAAAEGGAAYRTQKFLRRNRWAVGAGTVATLALLATTAVAVDQAARARDEAEVSARQRERADRTNVFLREVLGAADITARTGQGPDVRLVDVLDGAAERLWTAEGLEPDDRVLLANTLIESHQSLRQLDRSEELTAATLGYIAEESSVSPLRIARVMRSAGHNARDRSEFELAAERFEEALAVAEGVAESAPGFEEDIDAWDLAMSLRSELADVYHVLNNCELSEQILRPILGLREQVESGDQLQMRYYADNLAGALSGLASCRWVAAEFDAAYPMAVEALRFARLNDPPIWDQVAIIESNCAFYALELEDWARASVHLEEAIRISAERGAEEQRNGPRWIQLARAQAKLGEPRQASESLDRGEQLTRALYDLDEPRMWRYLGRAAQAAGAIGDAERASDLFEEAVAQQRRSETRNATYFENLGRWAELLHEIDPADARIDALLQEALAPGVLDANPQEARHRARFQALADLREMTSR